VAFSGDGQTLAGGGDRTVTVWDVQAGRERLSTDEARVGGVTFSPDGKTLAAAAWDGTVTLLDPATGRPLSRLAGRRDGIPSVTFNPDGHTLAVVSDDRVLTLSELARRNETLTTGVRRMDVRAPSPDALEGLGLSLPGGAALSGGPRRRRGTLAI